MGVTIRRADGSVYRGPTGEDFQKQEKERGKGRGESPGPPPDPEGRMTIYAPHHIWSEPNERGTAKLLYATGDEVPEEDARKYGLLKAKRGAEDKAQHPVSDKHTHGQTDAGQDTLAAAPAETPPEPSQAEAEATEAGTAETEGQKDAEGQPERIQGGEEPSTEPDSTTTTTEDTNPAPKRKPRTKKE